MFCLLVLLILVKLDLMDEKGQLANVFDKKNLDEYASNFLLGRKTYFLIKIIPEPEDESKKTTLSNQFSTCKQLQLVVLHCCGGNYKHAIDIHIQN